MSVGSPDEALGVLRQKPCQLVIQDMNFTRRTSGEEGLALLREIEGADADDPGDPDHGVGIDRAGGRRHEGRRLGLRHQAVDQPADAAGRADGARPGAGAGQAAESRADRATSSTRATTSATSSGSDPRMLRILELIGRVAPTDASVLITGESGTGKELVAEAIHRNSRRVGRPFVKVNLGGISSTLFESEMFGHVRGAFTDARADRKGRFELAHGGTIFLDEIGDLDPPSQVKMLRVLQDRTFEVLGSSQRREVDVRVVSATNRPLADMVSRGEFREDLLYRINLIAIHLPPLRERPDDIADPQPRGSCSGAAQVYQREPLTITAAAARWLQGAAVAGQRPAAAADASSGPCWSSTATSLDVANFAESAEVARPRSRRARCPPVGCDDAWTRSSGP